MKRFTTLSAAAVLACAGLSFAQDGMKDQPDKGTPTPKAPETAKPDAKQPDTKKLNIGDAAPAMSIEKWVKGEPVTGFEKGRVYVVEFWATWCGPCKISMPHLSEIQKEYKSKGLTVIGVASPGWRDELEKVQEMVKDKGEGMGYTIAWDKGVDSGEKDKDDKPIMRGLTSDDYFRGVPDRRRSIPTAYVIDQKGNLAWSGHPMRLDYVLDDILAGKWDYKESPANLKTMLAKMEEEHEKIMNDADADPKAALKALTEFEQKYPKVSKELVGAKYTLQMATGAYADAAKSGDMLVDQFVSQKNAQELNVLAWNLVDPDGEFKGKQNLPLAMRAAQKAVEFTSEKNAAILDTLARCYWIKGDKVKAVDLQKKAIAVMTKDESEGEMGDQLRGTLKDYEGGSN